MQAFIVDPMSDDFTITRPMMVALCDAFMSGELSAEGLSAVAFMAITSDRFEWTDDLIARVLAEWDSPEINYPLTRPNILRCRRWLLDEERHR